MNAARAAAIAGALLLATTAAAQTAVPTPTLHDAWLQELLDCDSAGAAETYSRLSIDTQTPQIERWLATARLLELRRIGIGTTLAKARSEDVPPPLQPSFRQQAAEPEDVQGLRELASHPDGKLLETLKAGKHRGNIRPLLSAAIAWAIDLTPNIQQNRRDLMSQLQIALRTGDRTRAEELWRRLRQLRSSRPGLLQRENALQILLLELQDKPAEAERLRHDYFPDWLPPRLTNDPSTVLARALGQFDSVRRDARPEEDEALRKLEQRMRLVSERSESEALHLLDHLPFYAEWLLH